MAEIAPITVTSVAWVNVTSTGGFSTGDAITVENRSNLRVELVESVAEPVVAGSGAVLEISDQKIFPQKASTPAVGESLWARVIDAGGTAVIGVQAG